MDERDERHVDGEKHHAGRGDLHKGGHAGERRGTHSDVHGEESGDRGQRGERNETRGILHRGGDVHGGGWSEVRRGGHFYGRDDLHDGSRGDVHREQSEARPGGRAVKQWGGRGRSPTR